MPLIMLIVKIVKAAERSEGIVLVPLKEDSFDLTGLLIGMVANVPIMVLVFATHARVIETIF